MSRKCRRASGSCEHRTSHTDDCYCETRCYGTGSTVDVLLRQETLRADANDEAASVERQAARAAVKNAGKSS